MKVNETKVYQIFAMLSRQERKDFVRFLRMHSKPKKAKIKAAYRFLTSQGDAIARGDATNKDWWTYAFPGEEFDVKAMRKHQNNLLQDLEAFLVSRKWLREQDAYLAQVRVVEQHLLLLSTLQERSRDHLFASYLKRTEMLIAELPRDNDRFGLEFRLEILKISHHQKIAPAKPREGLMLAQMALDRYYVLNSLKLEVANRNELRLNPHQTDLNHLPVIGGVNAKLLQGEILSELYLQIIDLQEDHTFIEVDALLEKAVVAQASIAAESWKDLLYILLNFAIRRLNEGQENYQAMALRIYLLLLETGLLQKEVGSFKHNFLNLVKLAFAREEHHAISQYVLAQKALISKDPEFKNAILFYECEAQFAQGKFAEACDSFWKVWMLESGRRVRYSAGIFLLKSYFEAGEWDSLKQFATDFKRIVSKDAGISNSKKEAYREFLKIIQRLCHIGFHGLQGSHVTTLRRLEKQVSESPFLIGRDWLLAKITQLWSQKK